MRDQFDISWVFETTEFEIAQVACICLCSNCTADQRLCFRYTDRGQCLFYLYRKFQASRLLLWLYWPICVGQETRLILCLKETIFFKPQAQYLSTQYTCLEIQNNTVLLISALAKMRILCKLCKVNEQRHQKSWLPVADLAPRLLNFFHAQLS